MEKAKSSSDIVMVHWGVEYTSTPSKQQKKVAQYLTDLGVDVVEIIHM